MGFIIEQECPQCGAPLTVTETDRLLECPFCDTKNFLFTPNYFRYILPGKAPDRELIYAPYLRFRGSVFFCSAKKTGHRIKLFGRPAHIRIKLITDDINRHQLKDNVTKNSRPAVKQTIAGLGG